MKTFFAATLSGSFALLLAVTAGCIGSSTSATSPDGAAMLLAEKPSSTMSVTEVRSKLEAEESLDEVAMEGKIGGAEMPFLDGMSAFFVTAPAPAADEHDHDHAGHDHGDHDHAAHDDEHADHGDHDHAAHAEGDEAHDHAAHDHDHGHDHASHDHENCPFCNRGVAGSKSLACVKLVDKNGQVVAKSADKLLSLKERQNVVVVGKPSIDELGNLYIEAKSIYVQK